MNIMIEELNIILNKLAPPKVIQVRSNDLPYHGKESRELENEADKLLNEAINSKQVEDWRVYKRASNQLNKFIDTSKKAYFTLKLNTGNDIWNLVKNLNDDSSGDVPDKVIKNGKTISSPKDMANTFNDFFPPKSITLETKFPKKILNQWT